MAQMTLKKRKVYSAQTAGQRLTSWLSHFHFNTQRRLPLGSRLKRHVCNVNSLQTSQLTQELKINFEYRAAFLYKSILDGRSDFSHNFTDRSAPHTFIVYDYGVRQTPSNGSEIVQSVING